MTPRPGPALLAALATLLPSVAFAACLTAALAGGCTGGLSCIYTDERALEPSESEAPPEGFARLCVVCADVAGVEVYRNGEDNSGALPPACLVTVEDDGAACTVCFVAPTSTWGAQATALRHTTSAASGGHSG